MGYFHLTTCEGCRRSSKHQQRTVSKTNPLKTKIKSVIFVHRFLFSFNSFSQFPWLKKHYWITLCTFGICYDIAQAGLQRPAHWFLVLFLYFLLVKLEWVVHRALSFQQLAFWSIGSETGFVGMKGPAREFIRYGLLLWEEFQYRLYPVGRAAAGLSWPAVQFTAWLFFFCYDSRSIQLPFLLLRPKTAPQKASTVPIPKTDCIFTENILHFAHFISASYVIIML